MSDWHYQHNGETKGPVDDAQLQALAEAGVVNLATPVWKTGYANWIPLSQSDFSGLARVGPPVTAGAGGAALAANQPGSGAGEYVVDDLSMWGFFTRALTQRYVQFTGRARRKEYWSYVLFWIIIFVALSIVGAAIDFAVGNFGPDPDRPPRPIVMMIVLLLFYLGTLLPGIAITVRRLHDIGFTGWLILISFIPYVGAIALLVMMVIPTSFGPNKHGPAPKAPRAV
jgi:uncharacterized membrane protein YhaH (DUF805 family)